MKHIKAKLLIGLVTFTLLIEAVSGFAFANVTTVHVRIVGTSRTIFTGDVTPGGCNVTDESNVVHTFATALAICALDSASKQGNFAYQAKDFGNLGLFLDAIAEDKGASDFSTYWLYDLNGQAAQNGISSQLVKAGDTLYFHFNNPNADVNQRTINDGITYLRSQQNTNGSIKGFSGVSGWSAMALSAAGIDLALVKNANTSLLDYLINNPPANNASATEWEKDLLAITAAGENPFTFGGTNYEAKVESFHNNSQLGSTTLLNDDFFGLLALIASGPSASSTIKQDVLNFIISHQIADGGFSWSTTGTSDVDDTSAALQALIAAQNNNMSATGLVDAITKAKTFLLNNQKSDGSFVSSPSDTAGNTASTSWAVMALSAAGMGSDNTVKKALSFIQSNQQENGSLAWQTSSTGETFTTSYAIPALEKKSWPIGIFTQTISVTPSVSPSPQLSPSVSPTTVPSVTVSVSTRVTLTPTVTMTMSPSPTIPVSPTEAVSNPKLGGLNLDGYCANLNEGSQSVVIDQTWSCEATGSTIDLTNACKWQYAMTDVIAKQDRLHDQYSWTCYTTSLSLTPTTTLIPSTTPSKTLSPSPSLTTTVSPTETVPNQRLGGLNLNGYCESLDKGTDAIVTGQRWLCKSDRTRIDLTNACQWQYGRSDVIAHQDIPNYAYSWICYTTDSSIAPTGSVKGIHHQNKKQSKKQRTIFDDIQKDFDDFKHGFTFSFK